MVVVQPHMIKSVGQRLIQLLVRQVHHSITQQEHVIVVMHFLNLIFVHQEPYLVLPVFNIMQQTGSVPLDMVYQVQLVFVELISSIIHVQVVEL